MKKPFAALRTLANTALAALLPSCIPARAASDLPREPAVRWVKPALAGPQGRAPGAKVRLVGSQPDGTRTFVLILARGDEALTALTNFARDENVGNAHFVAVGAVRDPEVGWFDLLRKEYKAMSLPEQMEVLTLSGDIALGTNGAPVVHSHLILGRRDGSTWGGHLLRATASPTLEVYITVYPRALHKQADLASGLQLIDPSIDR